MSATINSELRDRLLQSAASSLSFKDALYQADVTTIEAVLEELKQGKKPNKSKVSALENKLKNSQAHTEETQAEVEETEVEQPTPAQQAQMTQPLPEVTGDGFQFTCEQSAFATFLPALAKIATGSLHAILNQVLIEVHNNHAELTAFDLATALKVRVPITETRPGKYTVEATILKDLVSQLPAGQISFTHDVETNFLIVGSAAGFHRIKGLDADEFPALPVFSGVEVKIPMTNLQEAIAHTEFSASTDETKQVLCGVRLAFETETLEAASTDGHRLSVFKKNVPSISPMTGVTLPARSLSLLKNLAPGDESVKLQFDDSVTTEGELLESSFVRFEASNGNVFMCRLIDGQYPNYQQIVPRQFEMSAWIPRQALIQAVSRVALFTSNDIVRLEFDTAELKLEAYQVEIGDGKESLSIQWQGLKPLKIAFNAGYLMQVLKVVTGDEVRIQFNSSTSPALINAGEFRHIIMPVQIREN